MRSIPEPPAAEISTQRKAGREISVEVCLITRLYGGGARAGQLDERSWIRPPAFKSALRFWWRAGHAHLFANLAELRDAEARLFGSPGRFRGKEIEGGPGLVEVRVESATASANIDRKAFQPENDPSLRGNALTVAYFPAALTRDGEEQKLGMPDSPANKVRAKLIVVLKPEISSAESGQVENALKLFVVLGGIGARGRRGAGAIGLMREEKAKELGIPVTPAELQAFLKGFLQSEGATGAGPGLWCLAAAQAAWIGRPAPEAEAVQITLLDMLREVRQDRPHPPRWQGAAGWGQSRWPEGDAIRWKTRHSDPPDPSWKHQPQPQHADRYPRAALGLPIIVHFKKQDTGKGKDPWDHTISGFLPGARTPRISRFASPLFLRPVRLWQNGKATYVPVAILGPVTLPAEAVALVELTKNGVPPPIPAPANVVSSFRIAANANEAVSKVIDRFNSFNRIV